MGGGCVVYSIPNFPQKQNPNSHKNHNQQTQILSTPYFAYLGFWQFLCITPFAHTREHYFFSFHLLGIGSAERFPYSALIL